MTNKQYKKIDRILNKARSKDEITYEELTLVKQCIFSTYPCIGCRYNDGHEHYECNNSDYCKIALAEEEFDK